MRYGLLAMLFAAVCAVAQTNAATHSPAAGPKHGAVMAIGGGPVGREILDRFAQLAGGLDAPVILIPTAGDAEHYGPDAAEAVFLRKHGFSHVTVLHTRDRAEADTIEFVRPLQTAKAVWIAGGRQWRLVDSYLRTRTHRELDALLERGGVVAGTSAGATIEGSLLVRGAREGNQIMLAKGYQEGFGFLRPVAIDQHLIKRNRENDLLPVVALQPEVLGIGIDEGTAVVVRQDRFEVIGESKVAIYDTNYGGGADGKAYYWLNRGECFELGPRRRISCLP